MRKRKRRGGLAHREAVPLVERHVWVVVGRLLNNGQDERLREGLVVHAPGPQKVQAARPPAAAAEKKATNHTRGESILLAGLPITQGERAYSWLGDQSHEGREHISGWVKARH
eukprot:198845-Prorocentrum_minimum.AAC.1